MGNNNVGRKKREERKRKLAHKQFKRLGVRNNSAAAAPIDETDQISPVAGGLPGRKVHYSFTYFAQRIQIISSKTAATALPQSLLGAAE